MKLFHVCFVIAISLLLNRLNCESNENNNQLVSVETSEENVTDKTEGKIKFDSKSIPKIEPEMISLISFLNPHL